jgi:hypothetical protein
MHTDITWQQTIDHQDHLRRAARSWRLYVRNTTDQLDGRQPLGGRMQRVGRRRVS